MTTKKMPFGQAYGDAALALAQARYAETALRFIDKSLRDISGSKSGFSVSTLGLLVSNKLLEQASGGGIVPDPIRLAETWRKGAWDAALQNAYKALLTDYVGTAARFFGNIAPPKFGVLESELEAKLSKELCGLAPNEEPCDDDPVKFAYAMACYNKLRCEQRITLLYVLSETVRPAHTGKLPNDAAQSEVDQVSRQLWVSRSMHLSRMLAFGTLLGGEYLEQNKELVKGMYGGDMSVIEMLQVDGVVPSRWPAKTDDDFRKAIANA